MAAKASSNAAGNTCLGASRYLNKQEISQIDNSIKNLNCLQVNVKPANGNNVISCLVCCRSGVGIGGVAVAYELGWTHSFIL